MSPWAVTCSALAASCTSGGLETGSLEVTKPYGCADAYRSKTSAVAVVACPATSRTSGGRETSVAGATESLNAASLTSGASRVDPGAGRRSGQAGNDCAKDQQSPEPLEIRRGIHLVSLVSRATWCGPLNDETPRRLRLGYGALKTGPGRELRRAGDGGSWAEIARAPRTLWTWSSGPRPAGSDI